MAEITKFIDFKTIKNPYTGKEVTVMVTKGTEIGNAHIWDGEPTGSFWRNTKEAAIKDGDKTFHVDTNNPGGVWGKMPSIFPEINIPKTNLPKIDWSKIKLNFNKK